MRFGHRRLGAARLRPPTSIRTVGWSSMADGFGQIPQHEDGPHQTLDGVPFARTVTLPTDAPIGQRRHDIMLDGASRRSIWVDLALALAALVAIEFLSQVLLLFATGIHAVPEDIPEDDITKVLLIPVLPARAALVTLVLTAVLILRRQSLASVGLTARRMGLDVLLGIGAVGVAYSLIFPLAIISTLLSPEISRQLNENAEAIMKMVPRHSPSFFAWLALVIGFYEELLFRGFLMTRLRRALGSWKWAVVLSTAVFVIPHLLDQTMISVVPITILSVLFSVLTIWRRSILPAIIGHWLFNLSQFLGLYYTAGDSWT